MTRILSLPLPQPSGFDPIGVNALWGKPAKKRRKEDYENLYAFQVKALKLPEPVRQYRFAKELDRQFSADFVWTPRQIPTLAGVLLVEIQGGIWRPGGGAHSHPLNIERDIEKQQCIALLGYRFLPITEKDLKSGIAMELTLQVLKRLGWRPQI